MFVMVMSVRRSNTVTETVSKEININHNNLNNLKNINCINNHLKIIQNSGKNTSSSCCTIDKTIKRILPITVDTSTILSPSALTSAQSAQNPNKFLLTELNNYRKPPTIQVSGPERLAQTAGRQWAIWFHYTTQFMPLCWMPKVCLSLDNGSTVCDSLFILPLGTSGHHIKRFEPSACCTGKGL